MTNPVPPTPKDPRPEHPWNDPDNDGHDCADCAPDSMWKCDRPAHRPAVLPPLTPIDGLDIKHPNDLLSPEAQERLGDALQADARTRRAAYAAAATMPLATPVPVAVGEGLTRAEPLRQALVVQLIERLGFVRWGPPDFPYRRELATGGVITEPTKDEWLAALDATPEPTAAPVGIPDHPVTARDQQMFDAGIEAERQMVENLAALGAPVGEQGLDAPHKHKCADCGRGLPDAALRAYVEAETEAEGLARLRTPEGGG